MDLNSDEEIDPTTMIFPTSSNDSSAADGGDAASANEQRLHQDNQHYLKSIGSTITIRQLPSQGLSFQLWPAANTLVALLDRLRLKPTSNPRLAELLTPANHRLQILELGSGTGLAGIVAAATLSADVTVTDLPHVVPNLQFNVDANSEVIKPGRVNAAALRWGVAEDMEKIGREFDVVLASDVVYHDHLYEPLIETLKYLLLVGEGEMKTVFVMAHLRRWKKEAAFFKKARKLFDVEVLFREEPADGRRVGVLVYGFVDKKTTLLK